MKNRAGSIILWTFIFSLAYAISRYHLLGPVPWKEFPFFIMNKAISLCAFILLAFNFSLGPLNNLGIRVPESWLKARKALGMTAFLMVLTHAFISFMLFKVVNYKHFFEDNGTLTLLAGLSMLAGILAMVVLWAINLSFQTKLREDTAFIKFITSRNFLLTAFTLGAFHLFFMGYKGWLNPSGWHGGLPPISLVAFTIFGIAYIINLLGRK